MSIKQHKTRVTFVTEKATKEKVLQLVELDRANGRKMTFSKKVDEILTSHLSVMAFFNAK